MLKSIVEPLRIARFRLSVSAKPESQKEVSLIHNVFKQKTRALNDMESHKTQAPLDVDPMQIIFYRHSLEKSRVSRFGRYIDIAFDLGGPHSMVSPLKEDFYKSRQEKLVSTMKDLRGILRLRNYEKSFEDKRSEGEDTERLIFPTYRTPRYADDTTLNKISLMNASLSPATRSHPYFDVIRNTDSDDSMSNILPFDYTWVFEVRVINSYLGSEAVAIFDDQIDMSIKDKLLYGFDGFLSKRKTEYRKTDPDDKNTI